MNTITPSQFFATIFPEPLGPGQLMVRSQIRRSGKRVTDWCYSLHQAARQVERYRRTREVLFGVALHDRKQALARARRRSPRAAASAIGAGEESVTALPALWAEISVAANGPGGEPLPPSRSQALALFDAVPQPPSILVWTGFSFQAYWLLSSPWVLEDPDQRQRAKRLLGKVRWALASAGAAAGWRPAVATGEPANDLAGLMRVAGTFHHRGRRCWPVVVERLPRDDADPRWATEDFEDLEDPPERPGDLVPWEEGRPHETATGGPGNEIDFEAVWRGCSWLRHCHVNQATLPEAEWAAALSIVGRARAGSGSPEVGSPEVGSPEVGSPEVAGGRSLAHRFSAHHPGYAPHLTDQALKSALGREAPTCGRIGRGLGAWDRHCARCPHQGQIEGPIALGVPAPAATEPSIAAAGRAADATPEPAAAAATRDGAGPPAAFASPPRPAAEPAESLPAIGGRPQVELVVRIPLEAHLPGLPGTVHPAVPPPRSWAGLVRAAIASLPGPRGAGTVGGSMTCAPRSAVRRDGVPEAVPAALVDGLEELLATLGTEGARTATARQMAEALAAPRNHDHFGLLRSALGGLVPGLEGGLPTPRQLGWVLGSCRGRSADGRTIVRVARSPQGRTWAVRKTATP